MRKLAGGFGAFAAAVLVAGNVQAATYGLVIGIDDYENLPKLRGAVNDARDISRSLTEMGADKVITLLDRNASRDKVMAAWRQITSEAKPGDTIIFSYAGHGGQEPEHVKGSEPEDGMDEAFQLAGFHPSTAANRERILDDEINQMFAKVPHLKIVFVADSCHSGTMTRSFDPRAGQVTTRLGEYGPIINDTLPPPDPAAALISEEMLSNVLYFGAVKDGQVVQEFLIEKQVRGALSWSFARALRGHADLDRDGLVETRELERYLIENVRTRSEGRQSPQMTPRGNPAQVTLRVNAPGNTVRPGDLALTILDAPNPGRLIRQLKNVREAELGKAELIWDFKTGEIISSTGDVVARMGRRAAYTSIQPIVDKWLLLRDLQELAQSRPLGLHLDKGDSTHRSGTRLKIQMTGHKYKKLIAFNLAVDGTVQFLIPDPSPVFDFYKGEVKADQTFEFPLDVSKPFGADHFVALVMDEHNEALISLLNDVNNQKAAGALRKTLPALVKKLDFQMGRLGLFTAP